MKKTILLVEDDEDQAVLAARALRKHGISEEADGVVVARTGEEALDYLFDNDDVGRAGWGTPAFVLLDKNLPGTGGLVVLTRMRADERTRLVPVVLFSSSNEAFEDIGHVCVGNLDYLPSGFQGQDGGQKRLRLTHGVEQRYTGPAPSEFEHEGLSYVLVVDQRSP